MPLCATVQMTGGGTEVVRAGIGDGEVEIALEEAPAYARHVEA